MAQKTPTDAAASTLEALGKNPSGGGAGKWGMAAGALLSVSGGPSSVGSYVGSSLGGAAGEGADLDAAIARQNQERLEQDLYAKRESAGPRFQFGQGYRLGEV